MDGTSDSQRMGSRLSLIAATVIASVLTGCSYGSIAEAEAACRKWARVKGFFSYKATIIDYGVKDIEQTTSLNKKRIRYCRQEAETNQILGFEYPFDEDVFFGDFEDVPWDEKKVVKNFRY